MMVSEELHSALDEVVAEALAAAGVAQPPVDALHLADELAFTVAYDTRQRGRARIVQLAPSTTHGLMPGAILLRPEPRAERRQWAVAHEIGESLTARVYDLLDLDPQAVPQRRELFANLLAGRLLLPTSWFLPAARNCSWDLLELKRQFPTASHELIARRMLDFDPPVVVSVFDQGQLTWRKVNVLGQLPPRQPGEIAAQQAAHSTGTISRKSHAGQTVIAWPIHEDGWQREIVRAELPWDE